MTSISCSITAVVFLKTCFFPLFFQNLNKQAFDLAKVLLKRTVQTIEPCIANVCMTCFDLCSDCCILKSRLLSEYVLGIRYSRFIQFENEYGSCTCTLRPVTQPSQSHIPSHSSIPPHYFSQRSAKLMTRQLCCVS